MKHRKGPGSDTAVGPLITWAAIVFGLGFVSETVVDLPSAIGVALIALIISMVL